MLFRYATMKETEEGFNKKESISKFVEDITDKVEFVKKYVEEKRTFMVIDLYKKSESVEITTYIMERLTGTKKDEKLLHMLMYQAKYENNVKDLEEYINEVEINPMSFQDIYMIYRVIKTLCEEVIKIKEIMYNTFERVNYLTIIDLINGPIKIRNEKEIMGIIMDIYLEKDNMKEIIERQSEIFTEKPESLKKFIDVLEKKYVSREKVEKEIKDQGILIEDIIMIVVEYIIR